MKKLLERIKRKILRIYMNIKEGGIKYIIKRINHYLNYDEIDWLIIACLVLLLVLLVFGVYVYETRI